MTFAGQQLVKQPDGKLQLISSKTTVNTSQTHTPVTPKPPAPQQPAIQQTLLQSPTPGTQALRLLGQQAAAGQSPGVQVVRTQQGVVIQPKPTVLQVCGIFTTCRSVLTLSLPGRGSILRNRFILERGNRYGSERVNCVCCFFFFLGCVL